MQDSIEMIPLRRRNRDKPKSYASRRLLSHERLIAQGHFYLNTAPTPSFGSLGILHPGAFGFIQLATFSILLR